jgi:hypothetical protein
MTELQKQATLFEAISISAFDAAKADEHPGWYLTIEKALNIAENPRERDKAIKLMANGLAARAVEYAYGIEEGDLQREKATLDTVTNIYREINQRAKKDNIIVQAEFARDVYLEVIPQLLRINRVSQEFNNSAGYNSTDQIISFCLSMFRAQSLRGTDRSFVIFSQMCAQYDSGTAHESSSFSRGLLEEINPEKVERVIQPLSTIGSILQKHGIPVQYVTAQLSADPKNMLAMVPATVWSYVDDRNVVAMLQTLERHRYAVDELIKRSLSVDGSSHYIHRTHSYAERHCSDQSIMERTFMLCEMYFTAYKEWLKYTGREDRTPASWMNLEVQELHNFAQAMQNDSIYDGVIAGCNRAHQENYGSDYPESVFQQIHKTLMKPKWGTLDDTEKFYSREVQKRAQSQADSWRRAINIEQEVCALLSHSDFFANSDESERQSKARELLYWVERIANIGIGSRAIFNTALYASLGAELAEYNNNRHIAVMWPLEEDIDRFAIEAMNAMYQFVLNKDGERGVIPCVYPGKEFRQPLK